MKTTSNYRDLWILAGILIFKLILEALYIIFVQRLFAYTGFILAVSAYKYLLGTSLAVLLYFVMPRDNKPASVILQIHLFLIFLPMLSYFALTDSSQAFMLWSAAAFLLECTLIRMLPPLEVARIQHSKFFLYGLIGLLSFAVYAVMIRTNGLSLASLNLDATYEIREGIRFPFGMGYFVPWQGKVVNPFLMALGYKKRNRPLLFLGVFLQLGLFLITAQKAFLFIPFAIIGVMWFMRRTELLPAAAWLAPLGAGAILLQYLFTRGIYIPSLFIRRLLFLPAQLKFYWHEFFSQNPKLFYSQGSIGRVLGLENPYPMDAANLVGETFFNRPEMHANAGYVADAYARGCARKNSDIDLVILASTPDVYLKNHFFQSFGTVRHHQTEDWGKVTSIRVWYKDSGLEAEFGLAELCWISLPLDNGTAAVLADGYRVILDKDDCFKYFILD